MPSLPGLLFSPPRRFGLVFIVEWTHVLLRTSRPHCIGPGSCYPGEQLGTKRECTPATPRDGNTTPWISGLRQLHDEYIEISDVRPYASRRLHCNFPCSQQHSTFVLTKKTYSTPPPAPRFHVPIRACAAHDARDHVRRPLMSPMFLTCIVKCATPDLLLKYPDVTLTIYV